MAPIVTPYPRDGSDTSTWVTAPTSLPFCIMGLPLTSVSSRGQNFFPPGVGNTVAEVPLYTHRAARFDRDPPDERGGQPLGEPAGSQPAQQVLNLSRLPGAGALPLARSCQGALRYRETQLQLAGLRSGRSPGPAELLAAQCAGGVGLIAAQ